MTNKKKNIALLLGDPSGIGPELISKLLTQNELSNANITIIGEKNILNAGDKISAISLGVFLFIFAKYIATFVEISLSNLTGGISAVIPSKFWGKIILFCLDKSVRMSFILIRYRSKIFILNLYIN